MTVNEQKADELIAFLNQMVKLDPQAITQLVASRVPCNSQVADHPTIQVEGGMGKPVVGLLGVLNGFCGAYAEGSMKGWGPIAVVLDDKTEQVLRFERVTSAHMPQ